MVLNETIQEEEVVIVEGSSNSSSNKTSERKKDTNLNLISSTNSSSSSPTIVWKDGNEKSITTSNNSIITGIELEVTGGGSNTSSNNNNKIPQKRNRKPSSCTQCSKRKLRCNRSAQCDQCNSRKDVCKWEGGATPLFDDRAENDAKDLREQVARLEALVRELTKVPLPIPSPINSIPLSLPSTAYPSPVTFFPIPISHIHSSLTSNFLPSPSLSSSNSTSSTPTPIPNQFTSNFNQSITHPLPLVDLNSSLHSIDLRANDLAEALAQLAIQSFVLTEGSGGGRGLKIPPTLEELEELNHNQKSPNGLNGNREMNRNGEGEREREKKEMGMMGGGMRKGKGEIFVEEAKVFMDTLAQRCGLSFEFPNSILEANINSNSSTSNSNRKNSTSSIFRSDQDENELLYSTPRSSGSVEGEGSRGGGNDSFALSPGMLGATFGNNSRASVTMKDVLKYLPTHKEAMSAYKYYSGYVSWYSHPVHLATFEKKWAELQLTLELTNEELKLSTIDPFFIATFLSILALGLSMMPVERAIRDGFPRDKGKVVDFWLEGSMAALTSGRFLDNPSVEAVRAVTIISTYFVFMAPGESSGAGMQLLSLGVQVAKSLGLHRDPNHTPSKYTFFEGEDRRRLFWSLFSLCILSSACLGRTWSIFDLSHIDTELPLDATDDEIMDEVKAREGTEARRRKGHETPMTSLIWRMKLAVMAKKINDRAFGIKPTSYLTILELDKELREFEDSIPARYQLHLDSLGAVIRPAVHITVTEMRACILQISVAEEFIRLHRPWLVLAASTPIYQYSRDQVIKYSRLLLAIYRTPSCVKQIWGGLTYKASGAAIVLAVEILTFPDGSDVDSLRAIVRSTALQLETHKTTSSLCRKGAGILRFLLQKDASLVRLRAERSAKRIRSAFVVEPYSNIRAAFSNESSSSFPPSSNVEAFQNYGRNNNNNRVGNGNNQLHHFDDDLPHKSRQHRQSISSSNGNSHQSSNSSVTPPLQDSTRPSTATSNTSQSSHYPIYPYPNTLSSTSSTIFGSGDGSFDFLSPDFQRSIPTTSSLPMMETNKNFMNLKNNNETSYGNSIQIKEEYSLNHIRMMESMGGEEIFSTSNDDYSFNILPSPLVVNSSSSSSNQINNNNQTYHQQDRNYYNPTQTQSQQQGVESNQTQRTQQTQLTQNNYSNNNNNNNNNQSHQQFTFE